MLILLTNEQQSATFVAENW